jgi:hypothetical protein
MTNPLIDKYNEIYGKKEEPQTAFELATNFKEAIDKQKEDKIRYLASLPQSTVSGTVNVGSGNTAASNYISANNSSVSYTPYRSIKTHDIDTITSYFTEIVDKVKNGTALVTGVNMEMDMIGSFSAGKKMTFDVYVYD